METASTTTQISVASSMRPHLHRLIRSPRPCGRGGSSCFEDPRPLQRQLQLRVISTTIHSKDEVASASAPPVASSSSSCRNILPIGPAVDLCSSASSRSTISLAASQAALSRSLRTQWRTFSSTSTALSDNSTTPAETAQTSQSQQPQSGPTPRPRRSRRRAILWSIFFLLVGAGVGTAGRLAFLPPAPPVPGTPEDEYLLGAIAARAETLPLVKELTALCEAPQSGGDPPTWSTWTAYSSIPPASQSSRITSGALAGSRGIAYQRVFRDSATGECVSVVYLGGGLSGWPGVVHGGLLATLLDESLGRVAIRLFPAHTGVTANLDLRYRKPTRTDAFYVVRARPSSPPDLAAPGAGGTPVTSPAVAATTTTTGGVDVNKTKPSGNTDRKMWVEGTISTLEGKVCVEAKALFVVPKSVKLAPIGEGF